MRCGWGGKLCNLRPPMHSDGLLHTSDGGCDIATPIAMEIHTNRMVLARCDSAAHGVRMTGTGDIVHE